MVEEAFGDGDDGAESTEDRCGVSETPVGIWEGEAVWGGSGETVGFTRGMS